MHVHAVYEYIRMPDLGAPGISVRGRGVNASALHADVREHLHTMHGAPVHLHVVRSCICILALLKLHMHAGVQLHWHVSANSICIYYA